MVTSRGAGVGTEGDLDACVKEYFEIPLPLIVGGSELGKIGIGSDPFPIGSIFELLRYFGVRMPCEEGIIQPRGRLSVEEGRFVANERRNVERSLFLHHLDESVIYITIAHAMHESVDSG